MGWFITDLSTPAGAALEIIATSIATVSVHRGSPAGIDITIPVPDGTLAGMLMLAFASWNTAVTHTAPGGWTEIVTFSTGSIYSRIAEAGDAADYTWTWVSGGNSSNTSRGGTMITIENADTTLGNINSADNQLTVPDVEATETGSMLVAFNAGTVTEPWDPGSDPNIWDANSPLIEQAQHIGVGSNAYEQEWSQILATEDDLTVGTISGRTFSSVFNTGATRIAGIIVNPAAA
jgi:hypothetical protein